MRCEIGVAFVAVAGDRPVGYVLVDLVDGAAHVEQVSVDPTYGRQGVGAALLERAARWATAHGLHPVTLITPPWVVGCSRWI
ncbi:MAG TPA: GNAT family N-acetyltransferase [Mycobacteriales bacterium]